MNKMKSSYSLCTTSKNSVSKKEELKEGGFSSQSLRIEKNFWEQGITRKDYLTAAISGIVLIGSLAYLFYENIFAVLFLIPLGVYRFRASIYRAIQKKKQEFNRQFLDALQSLQAQLNVGYSMENAMKEVQKDLLLMYQRDSMIVKEFTYMVRQLNLNLTAEQAWREFAARVQVPEVDSFVTIFVLAKRSGGDSIAIIKSAIRQLNDKAEIKQEIETVITAKRLEFYVMTLIPFGMIFYMKFSFPEFMDSLYGNIRGVCFMSVCLLLYFAAWRIGNRIVEIEV